MFRPYPKSEQLKVKAGTDEAKALLKRAFGRKKKVSKDSTTASLKRKARDLFNAFIRKRDEGEPCISCGDYKGKLQAGHFYSAGKHNHMRFLEDNVHGQCLQCNFYLSGNLINYRVNLTEKIGLKRVEALDLLAKMRTHTKDDRFLFLEIIKKYGKKSK